MCSNCSNKAKRRWSLGISVLICAIAIALGVTWALVVPAEIEKQFVLQPGTTIYDTWFDPPIDSFLELYLWNWTNSEDYLSEGYKPRLEQLGPYTFREKKERVGIEWNDDYTVTFYQKRIWHYEPQRSNGDLENDKVVTINPILLTVGFSLIDNPLLPFLDQLISMNPQIVDNPFYNVPVKEILFDGYDDYFLSSLLEILDDVPELSDMFDLPPYDKFGWFYGRNESETYDGNFTIGTGVDGFENLGVMKLWNGVNQTDFYRDQCGKISGSTGELWPPFQEGRQPNVTVFASDICSSMSLEFDGEFSLFGVDGFKWKGNDRAFDNGNNYNETKCQCTAPEEKCPVLKSGALDVSRCKMGAPATVSYPHFYLSDESYLTAVEGMNPSKKEHEFMFALEPHTGVPLQVKAQLQVNLQVQPYGLTILKGIPEVMLPVLWFRQTAGVTEDLASDLKLLLILPDIGIYIAIGIAVIGVVCFVISLYFSIKVWK